jgi:hypothetical protein
VSVMPHSCISLPVTFGTTESFHTESILFDVADVSLPFNAILDKPALYRFMVVAHYGSNYCCIVDSCSLISKSIFKNTSSLASKKL